jgi:hypothetical protein
MPTVTDAFMYLFPPSSWRQGLTLVHFSAQRKHSLRGTLEGYSDEIGSG